jgi:hypothetical protein
MEWSTWGSLMRRVEQICEGWWAWQDSVWTGLIGWRVGRVISWSGGYYCRSWIHHQMETRLIFVAKRHSTGAVTKQSSPSWRRSWGRSSCWEELSCLVIATFEPTIETGATTTLERRNAVRGALVRLGWEVCVAPIMFGFGDRGRDRIGSLEGLEMLGRMESYV